MDEPYPVPMPPVAPENDATARDSIARRLRVLEAVFGVLRRLDAVPDVAEHSKCSKSHG